MEALSASAVRAVDQTGSLILQQSINGLTIGCIYALVALGYSMVYGVLELLNFAHGELFMLGAYVAIFILGGLAAHGPVPLGLLVIVLGLCFLAGMFFSSFLGVIIEKVAYRPLRYASRLAPILTALGVSILLQNTTMLVAGRRPWYFPAVFPVKTYVFAGAHMTNLQIFIILTAAGLMMGLHYLVNRTDYGLAIRAVAEDKDTASLMGIELDRTISSVFVIGPALGAAAGVLFSLYYGVAFFNMGFLAGIKAFTAAVLGGIGNIPGAMLGGLLLGVLEAIGAGILPIVSHGVLGAEYKDIFAFVVLICVLVFKPTGLMGERVGR
jgi:branched-chain amino acid transport system permease protein